MRDYEKDEEITWEVIKNVVRPERNDSYFKGGLHMVCYGLLSMATMTVSGKIYDHFTADLEEAPVPERYLEPSGFEVFFRDTDNDNQLETLLRIHDENGVETYHVKKVGDEYMLTHY